MRTRHILAVSVLAVFAAAPHAQQQETPAYGPAKGSLVIVGNLEGSGILETFVQLAGGADRNVVIVPTAAGNRNPDGSIRVYKEEEVVAPWINWT